MIDGSALQLDVFTAHDAFSPGEGCESAGVESVVVVGVNRTAVVTEFHNREPAGSLALVHTRLPLRERGAGYRRAGLLEDLECNPIQHLGCQTVSSVMTEV